MSRLILMACVAMALMATSLVLADDEKDLAKFDGTWVGVSEIIDGKALEPEVCKQYADIVKGGKVVTTLKGKEVATATYKLINTTKTPYQFDVAIESGPLKGQTLKGIYKFEGEQLVACFGEPGKDRPTAFESKKGTGWALQVSERAKGGK